ARLAQSILRIVSVGASVVSLHVPIVIVRNRGAVERGVLVHVIDLEYSPAIERYLVAAAVEGYIGIHRRSIERSIGNTDIPILRETFDFLSEIVFVLVAFIRIPLHKRNIVYAVIGV